MHHVTSDAGNSIQIILRKIRSRDPSAIQELWDAYFDLLTRIADRQLAAGVRRTVDGEDVALSVMRSIFRRAEAGDLEQVSDRDGLWALMLTLLYHKSADQGRKHRALKRGGGAIRGDSIFATPGAAPEGMNFAQFADDAEAPELVVQLDEERERLFSHLGDEQLREIAQRHLDGESADEIAERLNVSPRTIRRKLELIRDCWGKLVEQLSLV